MPFSGCWERVKRAESHRHNMTEAWNTFLDSDPYTASSHIQDDGTGFIFVTPREGGVPVEIGLLLGEMLYQLRAALDGAVYASAIRNPECDSTGQTFFLAASDANIFAPETRRTLQDDLALRIRIS